MKGRIALCIVCGMMAAAVAWPDESKIPDPARSTIQGWIRIVGTRAAPGDATPDPSGTFTITLRGFDNAAKPNCDVVLDFHNCSDTHLCQAVVSGQTVDCLNKIVRGVTDIAGQVTFTILGAADNGGGMMPPAIAPGAESGCVQIFAMGVPMGNATAVVYDQDGALGGSRNGVSGGDLAIVATDVLAALSGADYRGRSDYNLDGKINGADLAFGASNVLNALMGVGSATGCAGTSTSFCPN
jgi:hypothetical protein